MDGLDLGQPLGELELRQGGGGKRRIVGRFPYGSLATLSDGGRSGRPRKESFGPRAFSWRVEQPGEEIHLLAGHSYDAPLASKNNGTLHLRDSNEALVFEADIAPELERAPYFENLLAKLLAGLVKGLSPGFRLPPERVIRRELAEKFEEEEIDPAKGQHGAIIRRIFSALLYELSLVAVPAYAESEVAARHGLIVPQRPAPMAHLRRWRA